MGNLVDFRGWLRRDLNDPTGATERFADADLDRAVARAVADLTLVSPVVTETSIAMTSSRTKTLPAGTFPGILDVEGVEYPIDEYPQKWVPFRVAPGVTPASVYVFTKSVPGTDNARIRWTSAHAIAAGSTTVPVQWDHKLAQGAYAYACLAFSTPLSDNMRYEDGQVVGAVDDSMAPREWRQRWRVAADEWSAFLGERQRERAAQALGGARVSWATATPAPLWPAGGTIGAEP